MSPTHSLIDRAIIVTLILWVIPKVLRLGIGLQAWPFDRIKKVFMNETVDRFVTPVRPASAYVDCWLSFEVIFNFLITLVAVNLNCIFFHLLLQSQYFLTLLASIQRFNHELCNSTQLNFLLLFYQTQRVKTSRAKRELWVFEDNFGLYLLNLLIAAAINTVVTAFCQQYFFGNFDLAAWILHNGLDFPVNVLFLLVRK